VSKRKEERKTKGKKSTVGITMRATGRRLKSGDQG